MRGDLGRRSLIRPAGDGADRADDPHPIGVGDGKNSTKSRLDHADHGHIETGLKLIRATAVAVLQATTTTLGSWASTIHSVIWWA